MLILQVNKEHVITVYIILLLTTPLLYTHNSSIFHKMSEINSSKTRAGILYFNEISKVKN